MQALTDVVVHELVVQARSKPARVFQLVLLDPVQIQLQRAKHTPMGFFEALHKQVRCSEAWMRTHSILHVWKRLTSELLHRPMRFRESPTL